ncbi:MAG: phospholipase D-like domain-containing protein [Acidobacteria bacterium]|nr:phospholipase D-like domain-containing protein [Acidobacteriota bacterium]
MPDDGIGPVLSSIDTARHSLDIKMFLFTDVRLIEAVIAAHRRGVKIRVMLNPARRSGESENGETHKTLLSAGVDVKDTHSDFAVTHEKSVVLDQRLAYIKTLNWAHKHFTHTRDYAVITSDKSEVQEVLECFNTDWERKPFDGQNARLIWCVGNGRGRIAQFIDEAEDYLYIQNERYQDLTIIERLVRARERGVRIHLMALPPHKLKEKKLLEGVNGMRLLSDIGIKIHQLEGLHLHGKMLLADGKRAIIGSINFAPGSFDERRELAIQLSDHHIVKRLKHVFEKDWEHSHRLDLSDEGIKKDLEKHGLEDHGSLALDVPDADYSDRER